MSFKYGLNDFSSSKTAASLQYALDQNGGRRVEDSSWDLLWVARGSLPPGFHSTLDEGRVVSQIPGARQLHNKLALARCVQEFNNRRQDHEHLIAHPATLSLPLHRRAAQKAVEDHPPGTWLLKPETGTRGMGIKLIRDTQDLPASGRWLVQRYINNPLLIRKRKTKLRVYLLVTRLYQLEAWLYPDGIVKIAVEPYSNHTKHLGNAFVHTIAARFQQNHPDYSNQDCLTGFRRWHRESGYASSHPDLWESIKDLFILTLMAAESRMRTAHRDIMRGEDRCFELFGADVMFDSGLKPWLLEINRCPSMGNRYPEDINRAMQISAVQLVKNRFFNLEGACAPDRIDFERLSLPNASNR